MRRIISVLRDYRLAELEAQKASPARLEEVRNKFNFADSALSSVPIDGVDDTLAEVMTSGDFTNAIMTFVRRRMVPTYQEKRFNFEPLVWANTVSNFLTNDDYQKRAGLEDLENVGEKGQARPASVVDATHRAYRVYRWQKQVDFSMEAIVNDDMGYLSQTVDDMGTAARRTLEKHASNWMFNATTVARLVTLGALYSTTGRLTTARISTGRMAFNQRTDDRGEPILAQLNYIVIHSGLVDTAAQIQASTLVPELATNAVNVVKGTFSAVEDPYLAGTAPNLPWMALSNPSVGQIKTFVYARRQGVPGPMVWRKKSDMERVTSILGGGSQAAPVWGDFETGDIILQVYDEWGTYINGTDGNLYDHRGAYYSSGTAA